MKSEASQSLLSDHMPAIQNKKIEIVNKVVQFKDKIYTHQK